MGAPGDPAAAGGAEPRRKIPSVDALLRSQAGRRASQTFGRALLKHALASTLAHAREAARLGASPPPDDELLASAVSLASWASGGPTTVINATGVVLHTGLGRAPLPEGAAAAAARVASAYSDLEVERRDGSRGRRTLRAERLLLALSGAEDALVVNNGAAALFLCLSALARGKQVPVSRGELIEIGGEFRIPDILTASGARLVEVGTTNRTRAADYRAALTERTALLLKVHPSNYRVVGFTATPTARELAQISRRAGVPFVYDLGSGLVERGPRIPEEEPSVVEAIADGADLVIFSGDKLLGGPQAGIVLGRADLVDRLRRHAVARAVRVDKMQAAALEHVLASWVRGDRAGLPVWRMLREPPADIKHRAQQLATALDGELEGAHVVECASAVGGGSLPGMQLPSFGVEVRVPDPTAMAARLRTGSPCVFCRVSDHGVVLDLRTVGEDELPELVRAIRYALEGDDLDDD